MQKNFNLDYPMLGLHHNASAKEIKRAYAQCLKTINLETQAAEFEKLRAEYEFALMVSKNCEDTDFFYQEQEQEQEQNETTSDLQLDSDAELVKPGLWTEPETPFNNNLNNATKTSNFLLVETPYALMDAFNQELLNTMQHSRLLKVIEVENLLTNYLSKDEFFNLESKEALEYFLIDSLYKNLYGINNLIVLWAAKKVFNWDQTWRVTSNYNSVFYVDDLLLTFGNHQDAILRHFLLIVQTPKPKDSKLALAAYEELVNIHQNFAEFCVPTDHLKNWQLSFNNRNFFEKFKDKWVDKLILTFYKIVDLPPFKLFIFMIVFLGCIRFTKNIIMFMIS
jgi:hypothetical protein